MVTRDELADALATLKVDLKKQLDESIALIRDEIIKRLTDENQNLQTKISALQSRVNELETKFEENLQYQRGCNVVITGFPGTVEHKDLEGTVITLFNSVCFHNISPREIVACHRLSARTNSVIVKFLNKKDATALLKSRLSIKILDLNSVGLGHCDKIYVSEHLTPFLSELAYRCRCLKREKKIFNTKVENGTIKILFSHGGSLSWHNIQNIEDIKSIIPGYGNDSPDE